MKEELGQRIRQLREERGLSRQELCGLEDLLTIRQLQRIEKGQSLPTLATALYIADQLGVSLDALANRESLELPAGYIDLKYRLEKLYHYGNEQRLQQKEALIDEIYEKYFDQLPEEEQVLIQIRQASIDMMMAYNANYDQGLLEEYLHQAMKKEKLSLTDLEIINLRMLALGIQNFDKEEFIDLVSKILLASAYIPITSLERLQDVIILAAAVLSHYQEYSLLPDILEVLEAVMTKRNDFQDKVFSYAIQWKIALFIDYNLEKAVENFQKVKLMLDLLPEEVLKKNMKLDWEQDMERFEKVKQDLTSKGQQNCI